MSLNPETLTEESDEEKRRRQNRTGVMGVGRTVTCQPTEDPMVIQTQHRAVCLIRPYPKCPTCPHRHFTLLFNGSPTARFEQVLCPRWKNPADRIMKDEPPAGYVPVELYTCESQPFEFCSSCPSREDLSTMGVDKTKDGWYSRWSRFRKEDADE